MARTRRVESSTVYYIAAVLEASVASCERELEGADGIDAAELGVLREHDAGARLERDVDVPRDDVLGGLVRDKRRNRFQHR